MYKVSQSCTFKRYTNKMYTTTGALLDYITKYYYLTKSHEPNAILSSKPSGKHLNSTNI